jgi:hypothetical protein
MRRPDFQRRRSAWAALRVARLDVWTLIAGGALTGTPSSSDATDRREGSLLEKRENWGIPGGFGFKV